MGVPEAQVKTQTEVPGAVPFDIAEVAFTHYENRSTFDYSLQKYDLKDPALHVMAPREIYIFITFFGVNVPSQKRTNAIF